MDTRFGFQLNHVQGLNPSVKLNNGQTHVLNDIPLKHLKPKEIFEYIRRGAVTGSKMSLSALDLEAKDLTRVFRCQGVVEKEIKAHASKTGCLKRSAANILFWTGYLSSLDIDYVTPPFEIEYRPELDATPEPARTGKRGRPATGRGVKKNFDITPAFALRLNDYGDRFSPFLDLVFESYQRRGARFGAVEFPEERTEVQLSLSPAQLKLVNDISGHYGTTLSQSLMMVYSGSEFYVSDYD